MANGKYYGGGSEWGGATDVSRLSLHSLLLPLASLLPLISTFPTILTLPPDGLAETPMRSCARLRRKDLSNIHSWKSVAVVQIMVHFSIPNKFIWWKYNSTKYQIAAGKSSCTLLISFWLPTTWGGWRGGEASWANWEKLSSVQTEMEMGT